jgi:hypothetical protein
MPSLSSDVMMVPVREAPTLHAYYIWLQLLKLACMQRRLTMPVPDAAPCRRLRC